MQLHAADTFIVTAVRSEAALSAQEVALAAREAALQQAEARHAALEQRLATLQLLTAAAAAAVPPAPQVCWQQQRLRLFRAHQATAPCRAVGKGLTSACCGCCCGDRRLCRSCQRSQEASYGLSSSSSRSSPSCSSNSSRQRCLRFSACCRRLLRPRWNSRWLQAATAR